MKGIVKCIIAGAIIIGIGLAIVIITLAVNGWSVKKPEFEMLSYTAEGENSSLDIRIGGGQLKTQFYDGDKIVITYPSSSVFKSEINESNGVFHYSSKFKSAWIWGSWDIPETVIKLPKDGVFDLNFEVDAGTVNIASGSYGKVNVNVDAGTLTLDTLTCESLYCEINAGECKVKRLKCPDINLEINAGALFVDVEGIKSEYDIKATVNAGSCNVGNQTVAGGKKLVVECNAGSVKVTFND